MKITIYGPPPEVPYLAQLIAALPQDATDVVIQAQPRRVPGSKICMRPGWLEYTATVQTPERKFWLVLVQERVDGPVVIKEQR